MLVLAIDTATADLVTGLVETTPEGHPEAVIDRVISGTRAHNEQLIPTIEELLAEAGKTYADLDAIVVGSGPGPFTGLRVGMATAQALGVALDIPVHGVCTHDAIANGRMGRWLVATDARRKEVYWAAYESGRRVAGPEVAKPETLADPQAGALNVAIPESLAGRLPESLAACPRQEASPRARGLVAVADLDSQPGPLVPLYLRRPDAVPPALKPVSPALSRKPQP